MFYSMSIVFINFFFEILIYPDQKSAKIVSEFAYLASSNNPYNRLSYMSSPITIKDIAKALNISASTVSRALKNHPDISRDTKDAVNELAVKLRYKPNAVALSLKLSLIHI